MTMPSLIVVPAACVLILTSTASHAQDKPGPTTASKPVTTLSKAAKQASKPTTVSQDTMAKSVKQGSEKENARSATQSTPVSERSYEGCEHSKNNDA